MAHSTWTCGTCTLVHEQVAAQCTSCSMCGAARTPPDTKSSGTQRAMDLFNAARSGGKAKAARSGRSGGSWRSTTVGRPSVEIPSGALPHGNRDRPGHSALKRFHPALCVGNEIAASLAVEAKRPFAYVLSTVSPLDVATLEAWTSGLARRGGDAMGEEEVARWRRYGEMVYDEGAPFETMF